MTQFLPPNLLALFAPRDAIPYKQPVKALTWEKDRDRAPYTGISQYVNLFEDSKDTPPPTRGETKEEKKIRKIREKLEKRKEDIEEEVKTWDPHNDPNAGGDAFKTLFVSRINYDTTESKLRREFEMYGKIRKVTMVKDIATGKPRGYAFIEYERERDMHTAYKSGDGKKIDNRRVLVDVERGRTVKGWRPRRLGGGLGSTRAAPTDDAARRSDRERSERSERGERGERSERGGGDRERERERSKGESDRHRDRESRDKRRRSPDKEKSEKDRDRTRDRDRDRDREKRRRDDRGDKDRRDRKRESDHKSSRRDADKDGGDVGNDKKEERSRDKERESRRHRDRDRDRSDKDKDRRHRDRDRGKDREGRSEKEDKSSNRNPVKEEYVGNSDMKKEYQENYEGKYYGGQGDAYNNTDQNNQSNNGFYQAQDGDTDTGYQQENYSNSKQYANQGNYGYDAPMQQDDY